MTVTLGELAVRFGCELRGDPAVTVDSVAALSQAGPAVGHLPRQSQVRRAARRTRARARSSSMRSRRPSSPVPGAGRRPIRTPLTRASRRCCIPIRRLNPGVHPTATVDAGRHASIRRRRSPRRRTSARARASARAASSVPACVIERGAVIGDDARFVARVFVGHRRGIRRALHRAAGRGRSAAMASASRRRRAPGSRCRRSAA